MTDIVFANTAESGVTFSVQIRLNYWVKFIGQTSVAVILRVLIAQSEQRASLNSVMQFKEKKIKCDYSYEILNHFS